MSEELIKAGWENQGDMWWFEDSLSMCLRDALFLHRSCTRTNEEEKI